MRLLLMLRWRLSWSPLTLIQCWIRFSLLLSAAAVLVCRVMWKSLSRLLTVCLVLLGWLWTRSVTAPTSPNRKRGWTCVRKVLNRVSVRVWIRCRYRL